MAWPKGRKSPNKGRAIGGRPAGKPNKATADARAAIAAFVELNTPRLQGWLDQVANGVKNEKGKYIVLPDPIRAFSMVQDIIEYHVPKLNRTELTGKDGGPPTLEILLKNEGLGG